MYSSVGCLSLNFWLNYGMPNYVVVSTRSLSVNDFMLTTSGLYSDVAAGKKDNVQINLMSSELRESGISTIGEVGSI